MHYCIQSTGQKIFQKPNCCRIWIANKLEFLQKNNYTMHYTARKAIRQEKNGEKAKKTNIWIFEFWNNCIQQYNFKAATEFFSFSKHKWAFAHFVFQSLLFFVSSGDLLLVQCLGRFAFPKHAWAFARCGRWSLRSLCRSSDLLLFRRLSRFAFSKVQKKAAVPFKMNCRSLINPDQLKKDQLWNL